MAERRRAVPPTVLPQSDPRADDGGSRPSPEDHHTRLTSARVLARSTVWNLIGQGAPALIAVPAIPILVHALGIDRFGVLSIAWMLVGYFSLFDLGLGRALTQLVAVRLGTSDERAVPAIAWTALALMLALGCVGALAAGLASPWLVRSALIIPVPLQAETLHSFYLLAASIPVVITTAGLAGILEATQRFAIINAIRLPLGVFTYLGPLLVLPFSTSMFWVTGVLLLARLLALGVHFVVCLRVIPALGAGVVLNRAAVGPLFRFGGWMTASNIVNPLMVYLDRFLIGSVVSVSAVAYYCVPFDAVAKTAIVPAALVGVLFPAFATSLTGDRSRARALFDRGVTYIFLALFPLTLVAVTLSHEILELWLGAAFARTSGPVLRWVALGFFANGLAQVAFALLQGAGRADLTGRLHIVELPFYLGTLWWLLSTRGIEGAALAFFLRMTLDVLLLFALAWRIVAAESATVRKSLVAMAVVVVVLSLATLPGTTILRALYLAVTLPAFGLWAWFRLLTPTEKGRIRSWANFSRRGG